MRPAIRYCAGWACAALAATTVSWVAIKDVVATAAVGDPVPSQSRLTGSPAVRGPVTGPTEPGRISTPTATTVPSASLSPRERIKPTPAGATGRSGSDGPPRGARAPSATGSGDYQGFVMTGGQVVVQMRSDSASLVTAVPASGFETQTWETDSWFRVDFVGDERRSSLIVAWNGQPPVATVTEF
jgi:hypothetical protein